MIHLFRRVTREDLIQGYQGIEYLDLTEEPDVVEEEENPTVRSMVWVADLHRFEDLPKYEGRVYNGDVLLLNYSTMSKDELGMRRLLRRLHEIVKDVKGDVVMLPNNMIMVTPCGMRISRQKLS